MFDVFAAPAADVESHMVRYSMLLQLEECQQKEDIRFYDMEHKRVKYTRGDHFVLEVPGLAEKRPSVLRGDTVVLCQQGTNFQQRQYGGCVHDVRLSEVGRLGSTLLCTTPHALSQVYLRFSESFHRMYANYPGAEFQVRFVVSRTTIRRFHQVCPPAPHSTPHERPRTNFPETDKRPVALACTPQALDLMRYKRPSPHYEILLFPRPEHVPLRFIPQTVKKRKAFFGFLNEEQAVAVQV